MNRTQTLLSLVGALALSLCTGLNAVADDLQGPVAVTPTVQMALTPIPAVDLRPAVQLSQGQREALRRNVRARRERATALVDNAPPSPPGRESRLAQETQLRGEAEFHGTPGNMNVVKNVLNPIAQDGTQL